MKRDWFKIILGACFEVLWVIGLKYAESPLTWIETGLAIVLSFYLLISASKSIPVGTAYAVFVGLGTAGTVLTSVLFFGEAFKLSKVFFVVLLLIGVIGLKLVTPSKADDGGHV